jgi:putative protein-disulfide isomerase
MITLYYIHDPMCSWCWGYRPIWDALQRALPNVVDVVYVAGGLASDSNEAMPKAQQQMIQQHWRTIESKLGTRFNFNFWQENTPRRSTFNACRAAIAADKQGYQAQMVDAIQQAYYLRALNPSDVEVLITLAKELNDNSADFNLAAFINSINSEDVEQELQKQISLARALSQQGFPSLVLEVNGKRQQIPVNYTDHHITLDLIQEIINGNS